MSRRQCALSASHTPLKRFYDDGRGIPCLGNELAQNGAEDVCEEMRGNE